jgi:hypothetical protein
MQLEVILSQRLDGAAIGRGSFDVVCDPPTHATGGRL